MKSNTIIMPAGTYYIGDLCYILRDEWAEICTLTFPEGNRSVEGDFTLSNGKEIAIFDTAYGDGRYPASNGKEINVDSGSIGCVRVYSTVEVRGAMIQKFDTEFLVYKEGSVIHFGDISIDTSSEDEEDEEDEIFDEEDFVD